MKILAVYGSEYGQAEAVIGRVATILRAGGHVVALHRANAIPSGARADDFDAFLVAGSVIMGRYQRYVREFVRRNLGSLNGRPSAFISVNGHSPETNPEWREAARAYVAEFLEETRWAPRWTATFAGALRYTRYGVLTRWIMRQISARTGGPTDTSRDHELTDWAAVDRFAGELLNALEGEPMAAAREGSEPKGAGLFFGP